MHSRFLVVSFMGSLLVFVALNVLAAHLRSDCGIVAVLGLSGCADDIRRAGFPLLAWEEGGFAYHSHVSWPALLADVAIALAVSLAVGWAGQRWWGSRKGKAA